MATYLILNIVFLTAILLLFRIRKITNNHAWLVMFVALVILTAVFDNLLIYFHAIDYNVDKLLGIYIGLAPIEDFFYALLAAFLVPGLWHRL